MARRLPIPLGVLVATAIVAMLALVPVAEAAGLRIASPRNDRFFAQPPVRVKLQTARSVRSIEGVPPGGHPRLTAAEGAVDTDVNRPCAAEDLRQTRDLRKEPK